MTVSVFITSFNQKSYLIAAIESVLAQTLPPDQIVIVDDASTDGSQAVIRSYRSRYPQRITAVFHERNLGVAQTRRDALQAVRGDYVTYVDGDDRLLPTKLETEMHRLAERRDAQIVFSNSYYVTEDGRRTGTWIGDEQPPQGDVFRQTFVRDFPRRNLFRMELMPYALWRAVGFHDPALRVLEDWDMRIRLTRRLRVAYCDAPLSEIRVHRQGLSSVDAAAKQQALATIWRKNRPLLAGCSAAEQAAIRQGIAAWRARFYREQAKEALGAYGRGASDRGAGDRGAGGRRAALARYRQSWQYQRVVDLDLLLGLLLPQSLYCRLRGAARQRWGQGDGR